MELRLANQHKWLIELVAGVGLNQRPLGYEWEFTREAKQNEPSLPNKNLYFRVLARSVLSHFVFSSRTEGGQTPLVIIRSGT